MYTQPCFIRSKSNTVINNLLELGYQKVFEEQEYVNCECIAVKNDEIIPTVYDVLDNLIEDGFIDCGTNRVMFYAVASLTSDHDNNQWFVSSCGQWEKQKTPSKYMLINGHKASIYEILKHFNPWE